MLPLTFGFLLAGPVSGSLSDRYGARPFATGGMLAAAVSFFLAAPARRLLLPAVRPAAVPERPLAWAPFASPNRAGVMNSLPPEHRGAGAA